MQSYSKSCGRTSHHYKDGLAPVALFDTIEIDGCDISRASLHNLTFIKDLELQPGCRILVSKRNMIIPHIEDNLDRGNAKYSYPGTCPSCGAPTRVHTRKGDKGRIIETLHCDNPDCETQWLRQLIHFAGKKAMDIPLVGRTVSRSLGHQFNGSLDGFLQAAAGTYDSHSWRISAPLSMTTFIPGFQIWIIYNYGRSYKKK